MKQFCCDALTVKISDTAAELGDTAGKDIIQAIQKELRKKEEINIIFAAAPSQNETLRALLAEKNVPWEKINAFSNNIILNYRFIFFKSTLRNVGCRIEPLVLY